MGCPIQSAVRSTTADREALPGSHDGTRYEIIDGEVFVSHRPHWEHQHASTSIASGLDRWSRATKRGMANTAQGVTFSEYDSVAPDRAWIRFARLREGLQPGGKLRRAPEHTIEILPSGCRNVRRDRDAERKPYDASGVDEHRMVGRRSRSVDVYRRGDAGLGFVVALSGDDRLASLLLPEFVIELVDIGDPGIDA